MRPVSDFVGRTEELAVLEDALAAIGEGSARAIEISGPAGIGKSRLFAELAARADARGHVVLTGAGAELEQDLPFWVFVDALDAYVESVDPRRLERLDEAVRNELGQVLPSLASAAPAAAPVLHERYRTHRAMRELLEQLSLTKPLVLALDDFHWADPASTDLLVALLHRPPAAGVLLAIAARPRQLPARLATALERAQRAGTLQRIDLDALTREQARELVGEGADALYEETGGNPFYLEQLARAGRVAGRSAAAVELAGLRVPPSVAAALSEELALLTPGARRALDGASVAGDPFEIDLAAAAAGVTEAELLDGLDELARLELVRPTEMPRRFRFRHPIVRRAVYESTPGGWRIGAHERAAAALDERGAPATARAHHVERCARDGDQSAIAVLNQAGEETALRAPATAARWFGAALRLLPPDAPASVRVQLRLAMARAQVASGQWSPAHETLQACLETLPRDAPALCTQVAASCAKVEHFLGHHEQAHERLLRALQDLPDEASPEGIALLIELSLDGGHRMDYGANAGAEERALAAALKLGDPLLHAWALAACARFHAIRGAAAEAAPLTDEAAAMLDALPDAELARRLEALGLVAGAQLYLHRFEAAHRHADRAQRIGRATGQGQQFPLLYAILGMTWFFQGRLAEAVEPLDGAIEAARLTGNAQTIAWSLYARAKIALALGDVEGAAAMAQEALDLTFDGRPSHHSSHPALALAEAQLASGTPARAVDMMEPATGGEDMPLASPAFRALFLEVLARGRLALGDREAAERAAACARECASESGLPLPGAWADRALAAVALEAGEAARAAELAMRSAEVAGACGAPLEAAYARELAGRALAGAGDRERATELLQAAAAEFERRGAIRHRDAAERTLRALGHKIHRRFQPRAAEGDGVGSLTGRELEIARLIVDRRTNREIAGELFLSQKTVETHIRNIFAKLGAESRVEVARQVERADRLARA